MVNAPASRSNKRGLKPEGKLAGGLRARKGSNPFPGAICSFTRILLKHFLSNIWFRLSVFRILCLAIKQKLFSHHPDYYEVMVTVRRPLYLARFKKHVSDSRKYLLEADYIQASEAVWGALSSLVNAWSIVEVASVAVKKEKFSELFQLLLKEDSNLKQLLLEFHFDNPLHFASKIEGLHLYFLGKMDYPEEFIKSTLEDSLRVLEEVEKVLVK